MYAVTTILRDGDGSLARKAGEISGRLGVPLLDRKRGIEDMIRSHGLHGILVVGKKRLSYAYPGGEFFFHPGMAKLRIKEMLNGKTDQMVKALDLRRGDSVLDCTLGLGSDAIVASFVTKGEEITGLENSPVISLIVGEGLSAYGEEADQSLIAAMRRIKVVCADYRHFLKSCPDRSVDVVYFDPMFRVPGKKSCAIEALRPLADCAPLTPEILLEAKRVARRRVVVKEARDSTEFSRLGISRISGGRHSPVAYGIIE